MKKLCLFAAAMLLVTNAYASAVHTYNTVTPVSDSITLTRVEEFHSDHNISYTYIKADLKDENTALRLLKGRAVDKLDTVYDIAKTEDNVAAAVNADFFSNTKWNGALSLGIEVKDGKLLQSPINPDTMATVMYDGINTVMSYMDFSITLTAPNGNKQPVRHLNKHTEYYGDILMYTSEFNGGYSPAPGGEVCEVVVDDGKIVEFRRKMPSVKIPENGCVLVVSEGVNMYLANNFSVGDSIEIDISANPGISDVKEAFGGGALLVKDGQIVKEFSHVISGYNPRSAIGTDKTGTIVYLVAVDGRQEGSKGMSMSELASLMKSLGCYNAVNLDGGGSTNMVASDIWQSELHTVNSPSENRKVINAVGIVWNTPPGAPAGIVAEASEDTLYVGEHTPVKAVVVDKNMRPLKGEIAWSATNGYISNGEFYATDGGTAVITARYGEFEAKKEIYVSDKISGINVEGYVKLKEGASHKLSVSIFDGKGNVANATDAKGFVVTTSDAKVVVADGFTLKATGKGKSIVSISKDGAESYVSVLVDDEITADVLNAGNVYMPIPANKYTDALSAGGKGGKFRVGTLFKGNKTLISQLVNSKMKETLKKASTWCMIGEESGFSIKEDQNALYLQPDISKGGIRATDAQQWDKIVKAISESSKRDVFVLADKSDFGSTDFEDRVFRDYLASLKGKNVWVITIGDRNTYRNDNGVGYFTVANHQKEQLSALQVENYRYLEFTFGETTGFEWKTLY